MSVLALVQWSEQSATPIEVAAAITRCVVAGTFVAEVRSNPSLALRNVARVADWAVELVRSPAIYQAADGEITEDAAVLVSLAEEIGVAVPAGGPLTNALLALLVQQLLKALQDMLADALDTPTQACE